MAGYRECASAEHRASSREEIGGTVVQQEGLNVERSIGRSGEIRLPLADTPCDVFREGLCWRGSPVGGEEASDIRLVGVTGQQSPLLETGLFGLDRPDLHWSS